MTNENARKQLKMLKEHLKNDMYADDQNAINKGIEALEKVKKYEKAIEDIKAEIQKALDEDKATDTENAKVQAIALMWCLEVIDKYKAESEEK